MKQKVLVIVRLFANYLLLRRLILIVPRCTDILRNAAETKEHLGTVIFLNKTYNT